MDDIKIIKYFRYRTGTLTGNRCWVPRDSMKSMEETLSKLQGVERDNHVCYLIQVSSFPENKIIGIMFSDMTCSIAKGVIEKSW